MPSASLSPRAVAGSFPEERPPFASTTFEDGSLASGGGSREAFAQLYDSTAPRVYGLALRVLGSQASAEDVTREVYLEVWEQSARLDPAAGSVFDQVLALAHRRAVDRVCRDEGGNERDGCRAANDDCGDREHGGGRADSSADGRRVRSAWGQVSEPRRRFIDLAYFQGLTCVEIADALNLPLSAVAPGIRDALTRLRDILGG